MCDPVSGLLAASVALTAGGQIVGGIGQRNALNANARMAAQDAALERQLGAQRETQVRREYRMKAGLQRAQFAAAGVTLDSATAVDAGRDLAEQGALDAQSARIDSAARVNRYTNEAKLARAEGRMALLSGYASGAATAMRGGASLWPGLQGAG